MRADINEPMDHNQEDDDDFFQAFLHSLRSSCFQFLDFRDHVNIRGFLSVEVDGKEQRHLVLAETVARGPGSVMASFPLQNLTAEQVPTLTHPNTTGGHASQARRTLISPHLGISSRNQHTPKATRAAADHFSRRSRTTSRPPSSPQPRRFFPTDRCDHSNTTFTLKSGACLRKDLLTTSQFGENELTNHFSPKCGASATTVNVSPSKSHLRRRDAALALDNDSSASNSAFNRSLSRLSDHTIILSTEKAPNTLLDQAEEDPLLDPPGDLVFQQQGTSTDGIFSGLSDRNAGLSKSRKRAHRSPTGSCICSPCSLAMSVSSCDEISVVTFPDVGRSRGHGLKEHRRKRDKTSKKSKHSLQLSKEKSRLSRESSRHKKQHSSHYTDFSSFFECSAMDQECRITSVKPYYLVNHTDDVNVTSPTRPISIGQPVALMTEVDN